LATALAKGLSEVAAKRRHALPNAALPLVTLIGSRFGAMVGGSVVIESVFALPGLGRLAVTSALARDFPTVIGIVVVTCAVVVAFNVLVDLVAHWLDPRLSKAAA
jgi:peptide/nickel transport system permease protein